MARRALPSATDSNNAETQRNWRATLSDWGSVLRGIADPANAQLGEWFGKLPASTATVNLQVWGGVAIWRITAGWAMIAALIAGGGLLQWSALDYARMILLWLLVDPLWGALWRMAGGRNHLLSLRTGDDQTVRTETLRLPYVVENSPAAQLLSLDESNAVPWLVRIALPTMAIALVVASAVSMWAALLTLAMVVVAAAGWTWRRTLNLPPLLLHAVTLVFMPWLLTMLVLNVTPGSERWGVVLVLGLLWTLHAWGETHVGVWGGNRFGWLLLAVSEVAIALLLVIDKAPVYLPFFAILLLPGWMRALRGQSAAGLSIWWLAAMLVSAVAVGL